MFWIFKVTIKIGDSSPSNMSAQNSSEINLFLVEKSICSSSGVFPES